MSSYSIISMLMLITILALYHIELTTGEDCTGNEVHVGCARAISCQPSCDHPGEKPCPRMCSLNSCECKPGFVRDSNFTCIDTAQCNTSRTKRQATCGENEVAVACSSIESCQPSCDAPNGTVCPRMCSQNPCVCKEGFIRASKNNVACIEETQCSKSVVKRYPVCDENEQYSTCVNPCQASCEERNRKRCEPFRCMRGCVCSKGYFRATNNMNSSCIQCNN